MFLKLVVEYKIDYGNGLYCEVCSDILSEQNIPYLGVPCCHIRCERCKNILCCNNSKKSFVFMRLLNFLDITKQHLTIKSYINISINRYSILLNLYKNYDFENEINNRIKNYKHYKKVLKHNGYLEFKKEIYLPCVEKNFILVVENCFIKNDFYYFNLIDSYKYNEERTEDENTFDVLLFHLIKQIKNNILSSNTDLFTRTFAYDVNKIPIIYKNCFYESLFDIKKRPRNIDIESLFIIDEYNYINSFQKERLNRFITYDSSEIVLFIDYETYKKQNCDVFNSLNKIRKLEIIFTAQIVILENEAFFKSLNSLKHLKLQNCLININFLYQLQKLYSLEIENGYKYFLSGLYRLESLVLKDCGSKILMNLDLYNLINLEIDFENFEFKTNGIFCNLVNLKCLKIVCQSVSNIKLFSRLNKLEKIELYLKKYGTCLHTEMYSYNPMLKEVLINTMSGMKSTKLLSLNSAKTNIFKSCIYNIEKISLSLRSSEFHSSIFMYKNLKHLDLSNNLLSHINLIDLNDNLEYLNLSNNNIKSLNICNFYNLITLDVHNNKILLNNKFKVTKCNNLQNLIISNNIIDEDELDNFMDVLGEDCTHIYQLNMKNEKIEKIKLKSLKKFINLLNIDLFIII